MASMQRSETEDSDSNDYFLENISDSSNEENDSIDFSVELHQSSTSKDFSPVMSEDDLKDEERIQHIYDEGCSCKSKNKCLQQFGFSVYREMVFMCRELTSEQLDLVILGELCATTNTFSSPRHSPLSITEYKFHGKTVCRVAFSKLHGISEKRLKNLKAHYKVNGISPRVHKSKGTTPHNVTSEEDIIIFRSFLNNFAKVYALSLPGRMPGHKDERSLVLPAYMTKEKVYSQYTAACKKENRNAMQLRVFQNYWRELEPRIITAKPRTDLCFTCQKNVSLVLKSANKRLERKSVELARQEQHIKLAQSQRHAYNNSRRESEFNFASHRGELDLQRGIKKSNVLNSKFTYSFDFAQMVQYPHNPDQPGDIFFKSPRKCSLFGCHDEAFKRMVTYLIDESVDTGKGANTVISLLHHFLTMYTYSEKCIDLWADNCPGQNKNNYVIFYLVWRVLNGLNNNISYNFLLQGHTKFAPDRGFGAIKKTYRRRFISSLFGVGESVNQSNGSGSNIGELTGLPNGEVIIPTFDWKTYFREVDWTKIPRISTFYHFHISKDNIFQLKLKESADATDVITVNVYRKDDYSMYVEHFQKLSNP